MRIFQSWGSAYRTTRFGMNRSGQGDFVLPVPMRKALPSPSLNVRSSSYSKRCTLLALSIFKQSSNLAQFCRRTEYFREVSAQLAV